jgi:DNA-binding PadR family transcriptional regulator
MPRSRLGPFQQQLLYVVLHLGEKAYGMRIWQELEERTGEAVIVGGVYTSLERLERKGFVSSRLGDPTPERGGRAKRYYSITGAGARALQESERAFATFANLRTLVPHPGAES